MRQVKNAGKMFFSMRKTSREIQPKSKLLESAERIPSLSSHEDNKIVMKYF